MKVKPQLIPLVVLPGTLFWVFVILAAVTKNPVLITLAVVFGVGTFAGFGSVALRQSAVARKRNRRVWAEGSATTATVLTARTNGALNNDPYVELELDVNGRTVAVRQLISLIMLSKVQPGEQVAVKVDLLDPTVVVLDVALTPAGRY